jgi:hypothetical protein
MTLSGDMPRAAVGLKPGLFGRPQTIFESDLPQ